MSDYGITSPTPSHSSRGSMNDAEQSERRKQIREIMKDPSLPQAEKNRRIQSLMDGRRRSSCGGQSYSSASSFSSNGEPATYVSNMAEAAAAAADFYSSDTEGDTNMTDMHVYGYDDTRSTQSSITRQSLAEMPSQSTYKQIHGRSYSLQDWNDDTRAVAAASTSIFANNPAQISRLMEQSRPNCEHYDRNCTIISPCCGLAFGCRICHDECPVLPPPLEYRKQSTDDMLGNTMEHMKKMAHHEKVERRLSMPLDFDDEEHHHLIDRFQIKEVICRHCYTRQTSKSNFCIQCEIKFADYHCLICNLWMADNDNPYHCQDCGFCRVGGRENFKHCHDCGMCIDVALFEDHNCKAGKYMRDCPICQEDLFSSRHASHEMPCGHAIHWHCFKELTSFDTRCPVCKKTAETPEHMAATWSAIAMGIALQPVPPDMARCVNIMCNDCEQGDYERRWHFLGVRCMNCLSFNTVVESTLLTGREAAEFLDGKEAQNGEDGIPANISALNIRDDRDDDAEMEDMPGAQDTSEGSSNAVTHDSAY